MNINKVILMGRLTADPELKVSQSNVPVLRFTIAVSRRIRREETDFIDCVAFRQTAEFISKFFRKGSAIIAFGSLQIENWTDRDGKKQRSARVVVDEVQFGEKRGDSDRGAVPADDSRREPVAFSNASASNSDVFDDIKEISDDDLPF